MLYAAFGNLCFFWVLNEYRRNFESLCLHAYPYIHSLGTYPLLMSRLCTAFNPVTTTDPAFPHGGPVFALPVQYTNLVRHKGAINYTAQINLNAPPVSAGVPIRLKTSSFFAASP